MTTGMDRSIESLGRPPTPAAQACLALDPHSRASAEQLRQHEWLVADPADPADPASTDLGEAAWGLYAPRGGQVGLASA